MTTANKITIFRMLMVPMFVLLLYLDFPGAGYWALGVFILASVTDTVDGYIARHYNQVTDFGKFLDPLADKLLVISAMAIFTERGYMPGWALALVVARELAVTGLRLIAVQNGRVIAAGWSGNDRDDDRYCADACFWHPAGARMAEQYGLDPGCDHDRLVRHGVFHPKSGCAEGI